MTLAIHRRPYVSLFLAFVVVSMFGCKNSLLFGADASGRYQLQIPASGPLPVLRFDVSVAPHPSDDLTDEAITQLANPVYLALRGCAETSSTNWAAAALVVTWDPDATEIPRVMSLEGQEPVSGSVLRCIETGVGPRPASQAVAADATVSVVVVMP